MEDQLQVIELLWNRGILVYQDDMALASIWSGIVPVTSVKSKYCQFGPENLGNSTGDTVNQRVFRSERSFGPSWRLFSKLSYPMRLKQL